MKRHLLLLALVVTTLSGCDSVFSSKNDPVTDEIFETGRNEPSLINDAEYVPLFPFFDNGGDNRVHRRNG